LTQQGRKRPCPPLFQPTPVFPRSFRPFFQPAPALGLPPVLLGSLTPEIRIRVESFYSSVYEIFERWVNRPRSLHTRRSYKEGVLSFVQYRGIVWPQEASSLFLVSVAEVQEYRDVLAAARRSQKPSITGFRPSRRPSCGCPSSSPIRRTVSSSPASPPLHGKERSLCRRRGRDNC
jgi:hypothetical protein